MRLNEEPGDPDRHGGTRQDGDETALAPRMRPLPARLLHAVCRIEYDRRAACLGKELPKRDAAISLAIGFQNS